MIINIVLTKMMLRINLTARGVGGGRGGGCLPQKDKTSAPKVFSRCSFIPRADFETSLVMVSCYGYAIRRHKYQVVKQILGENTCFFLTSFNNKIISCGWNHARCLFLCYSRK